MPTTGQCIYNGPSQVCQPLASAYTMDGSKVCQDWPVHIQWTGPKYANHWPVHIQWMGPKYANDGPVHIQWRGPMYTRTGQCIYNGRVPPLASAYSMDGPSYTDNWPVHVGGHTVCGWPVHSQWRGPMYTSWQPVHVQQVPHICTSTGQPI